VDEAGANYTLTATATATGMTSATSNTFTVTVGSATQLVFTQHPFTTAHGVVFATQPIVAVADVGGNTVTGRSATVTLAIGTNPGGGPLTCTTNPLAASAGVATYAGCSINNAGNGYTLTATSPGLTSATTSGFDIT
jgi:trimeric autotransporter adhesin